MFCPHIMCVAAIYLCMTQPERGFISPFPVPLPNLGFSLAGFIAFHSARFHADFVTVTPWGLPPWADAFRVRFRRHPEGCPVLFFRPAQTLRSSQTVRAWTFLWTYQRLPHVCDLTSGFLCQKPVFPVCSDASEYRHCWRRHTDHGHLPALSCGLPLQ